MAGAGYKLFNTGDVLTAAQVNTYLNEQTVMVFASSTARTTALSGVLAEGMMSYLQDTNSVEVYNGTSWVNVGNAGDITEVQAGVGISIASGTGPIPVITNSSTDLITTAGDILYGTAADTVARLGIGTAGQVLKVNSGATAPEWGAATGDWVKITEIVNSSTAAFSFTSIPSTYRNLVIIGQARSSISAEFGTGLMRFNGSSSSIYDWKCGPSDIGGGGTTSAAASSYFVPYFTVGNTATANNSFSFQINIPNYKATTFHKTFNSFTGTIYNTTAADFKVFVYNGLWRSTNAITSIELSDASGGTGFLSGSVATLYGVM